MRKLVLVGLVLVGTMFAIGVASGPASAWCYRGYGYAAPVYGYGYSPWLYRSQPRYYYSAGFYRPRVWGWRSWGYRGGWGYRGWGYRGWGWGGRGWRRW
jgi:hypothetical protein